MPACNKCVHRHSSTSSMSVVGNATNGIRHHPHPHVRSLVRSLSRHPTTCHRHRYGREWQSPTSSARSGSCSRVHAFTDHAAASTLKMTAPTGTQVAVANIYHAPRCSFAADIQRDLKLEVGQTPYCSRRRNSTSVEQCASAFRGWHCCVIPILRDMQSDQITVIPTSAEGNSNR